MSKTEMLTRHCNEVQDIATIASCISPYKEFSVKRHNMNVQSCRSSTGPSQKKRKTEKKEGQIAGRWTAQEHEAFIGGLSQHGREWKKVADKIPTRTSAQIRSHAQKYFSKLSKTTTENTDQIQTSCYIDNIITDTNGQDSGTYESKRSNLSSSALEKVANIIDDPSSVKQEVENTLKSLHERYAQLQQLIEMRSSRQEQYLSSVTHNSVSVESNTPIGGPASAALELQQKRNSFSCISESLSDISPNRTFGSEELIALHVLRTSLKNPLNITKCPSTNNDDLTLSCGITRQETSELSASNIA